ncbi:acyltransferase family protein [Rhodococcus sp. T7]|uniref:acyltransferase family protein n=1 Tax=Rhodococcus sp. T7 TaxID=627444 RepID=UPI0013CC761E|nr:acyltransferase family protein [Rhodococcus sp. T7]KAF0963794.1 hypothetical protein MLGJGCBP_03061 [Rhodococcus sp. T7]
MTTITRSSSSRRKPAQPKATQRLDIQGLRMVAVMLVVLSHLFHFPRGGFVGVDVFFVISGFLITGSLLHTFEQTGRISFSSFYRRRIRRIVPAATLVLMATVIAAFFIYTGSRFKSTALDAVAAFFFVSNWRFGIEGTDYFSSSGPVSPLQHYWSLSVEEQFYFVWPAVILAIGILVGRKSWSAKARLALSAAVMGVAVLVSFGYSVLNTASSPTWAYFSTLTRVWELGVGALLAISISYFESIPDKVRPFIAWAGLIAITVGAFAITETGGGFPAPWAAVPVLGAAMVIAAGVAGEQKYLQVLTNRVSTYIGDISYSLYLWHWPVIVLLAALMDRSGYYFATALLLMFGLSIASYHFFENRIRSSKWLETGIEKKERIILDVSRWRLRTLKMSEPSQTIGIASLALVTAALAVYATTPTDPQLLPPSAAAVNQSITANVGPEQGKLSGEISAALASRAWPELSPTMDEAIAGPQAPKAISDCGSINPPPESRCIWGDPNAPKKIVIVGDSVAMTYVEAFKNIAESSGGQWQVRSRAMYGCTFIDQTISSPDPEITEACSQRKAEAISAINKLRPDLVVITNTYEPRTNDATKQSVTWTEWVTGMKALTSQFAANVGKVAFLAPPPSDVNVRDCYNKLSVPAECVSGLTGDWTTMSKVEEDLAHGSGFAYVNSRDWFCVGGYCPAFVGTTPVKLDKVHMTSQYADRISPALRESLTAQGLL